MSALTAHIIGEGIVFTADRNLTETLPDGTTQQSQGSKIFKWPGNDALVGYVGRANIGKVMMDDWLNDFIRRHPDVSTPRTVAEALQSEIQAATFGLTLVEQILQFAAFGEVDGVRVPEYYHIANVHGMDKAGQYDDPRADYGCSEELLGHWKSDVAPADLRAHLAELADAYNPQWFHHSLDLAIYNTLEAGAKDALDKLHKTNVLTRPTSLIDWENHAKFWILQYGAYFAAFYPAGQQFVGGAEALSIPWP